MKFKLNTEYITEQDDCGLFQVSQVTTYVPAERFMDLLRYRHQCLQVCVEADGREVLEDESTELVVENKY